MMNTVADWLRDALDRADRARTDDDAHRIMRIAMLDAIDALERPERKAEAPR